MSKIDQSVCMDVCAMSTTWQYTMHQTKKKRLISPRGSPRHSQECTGKTTRDIWEKKRRRSEIKTMCFSRRKVHVSSKVVRQASLIEDRQKLAFDLPQPAGKQTQDSRSCRSGSNVGAWPSLVCSAWQDATWFLGHFLRVEFVVLSLCVAFRPSDKTAKLLFVAVSSLPVLL